MLFISARPDEDDKYPRQALQGECLAALAAFCEVRFLIRRAEGFRNMFRRGMDLPEGFFSWENMPPRIELARQRVEECRPALTVGFRQGLQSKEHRISDWTLEHERAIERVTPLVRTLAKFKQSPWRRMGLAQRLKFARSVLRKFETAAKQELGLAYAEARGAADLLKLPMDDHRIVIEGAYACYRLDWLANSRRAGAREEMRNHVKALISIANDLKEYSLAEKIEAATTKPAGVTNFPKSALFDQFKGHLIAATKERLKLRTATNATREKAEGQEATSPRWNASDEKAAQYIRRNPGCKGDAVARAIPVTPEHFRSRIVRKLKARGFYNQGDGYYPPKRRRAAR